MAVKTLRIIEAIKGTTIIPSKTQNLLVKTCQVFANKSPTEIKPAGPEGGNDEEETSGGSGSAGGEGGVDSGVNC